MKPDLSNYRAAKRYLFSLKHHGAKYGIDRMRLLADRLGNPHQHFPAIHVAGTNGKGSVSAMLESIYRQNGYKVGLYTSPHLVRQGERIQVQRTILPEETIVDLTRELQVEAEALAAEDPDNHPSFFEFMTAMAFLVFARESVDLAIIETGLGGRLDATNILDPELSIITSISLDHVDILGDSLEKIAFEKAGILKSGKPCLLGALPKEAETVIREIAVERGCPLTLLRDRFGSDEEAYPQTNLQGSFQRKNAGMARTAAEILNDRFPTKDFLNTQALQEVNWPGRWQQVELPGLTVILDSSHNPEGCQALEENLVRLIEETGRKPDIAIGTLGAFRAGPLIQTAIRYARNAYLLEPHQPRAVKKEDLASQIPASFPGKVIPATVRKLFPEPGSCALEEETRTLVVTGSIYLIGEVSEALFYEIPAEESMLQDPIR